MSGRIYNISLSCPFLDVLAEKFVREYENRPFELADALFLMPSRRACLSLKEAFVRAQGLKPALLPKIVPVGDLEEDEIFLSGFQNEILQTLPPVIDPYEKLFLLARLIAAKPTDYGLPSMTFAQALQLARDLSKLMDTVYNEQLEFSELKKIVPEQYAAHWQETWRFLQIVATEWPKILEEKKLSDQVVRQNLLLEKQAAFFLQNPPKSPVVAAGITAAFPGVKKLLKTIFELDQGQIYLFGLDKTADDRLWESVSETHPQYDLKQLLDFLGISRFDVPDDVRPQNEPREYFVSEVMRSAVTTGAWRFLNKEKIINEALNGVSMMNCADMRQEALSIAIKMRETLETPEKTAAFVTADRNLARRVASELERWNIKADDSAGRPLHLMPVGVFLRQIIQLIEEKFSDTAVLSLVTNPFVCLGQDHQKLRAKVRAWELKKRQRVFDALFKKSDQTKDEWMELLKEKIRPLVLLFEEPSVRLDVLLETHLKVAQELCLQDKETENGAEKSFETFLWRGEDGRAAAKFFNRILLKAKAADMIEPSQYLAVLTTLMSGQMVRASFGTHPRLKILGPIEARFARFDVLIVGGLNEGVWPLAPASDPWLSRPMKKDFGMAPPEKSIGVSAFDFCQFLCAPEVVLTRSERVDGVPTNKSRWLLRLETVLKAVGLTETYLENPFYLRLGEQIDTPQKFEKIEPVAPKPPVSARPRKLSASAIEKLMRDPYEIYARYILKLKPLDDLDQPYKPSDYGSVVHKVLEIFNQQYPSVWPENADRILLQSASDLFDELHLEPEIRSFWQAAFEKTVFWLVEAEKNYRFDVEKVYTEISGDLSFEAAAGPFTITARADRIDKLKNGAVNVIDYKTGAARTQKEMASGFAPQLPIEGLIAREGRFCASTSLIESARVESLMYWKLGEKIEQCSKDVDLLLDNMFEKLKKLISTFDFEETPYLARPNPNHLDPYSDYEHLSRIKEWSVGEDLDE